MMVIVGYERGVMINEISLIDNPPFLFTFNPSLHNSLSLFHTGQVILIVAVTRCLDLVLSKLLQPRVISEVLGGIILGPSVLGHIPGYTDAIFPPESIPQLTLIANIGLVLYLFLVGVELDPRMVLKQAKLSISISAVGMALPFGLGVAVSYGLYQINHPGVPIAFGTFLLFMGVAISITVSKIIQDFKYAKSHLPCIMYGIHCFSLSFLGVSCTCPYYH